MTKSNMLSRQIPTILLVFCSFFASSSFVFAQDDTETFARFKKSGEPAKTQEEALPKTWQEKTHIGGNVALQFWGSLFVEASPMVGYELNKTGSLVGGAGVSYMYYGNQTGSIYGGRLFLRQTVWKNIFLHGEVEQLNAPRSMFFGSYNAADANKRGWGGSPLVGGGFYQGNGGKTNYYIALLYNTNYPAGGFRSPYSFGDSPLVIRMGFF